MIVIFLGVYEFELRNKSLIYAEGLQINHLDHSNEKARHEEQVDLRFQQSNRQFSELTPTSPQYPPNFSKDCKLTLIFHNQGSKWAFDNIQNMQAMSMNT